MIIVMQFILMTSYRSGGTFENNGSAATTSSRPSKNHLIWSLCFKKQVEATQERREGIKKEILD